MKETLIAKILDRLAQPKDQPELSEKGKKIKQYLALAPFGCSNDDVVTLMSLLLDEDLSDNDETQFVNKVCKVIGNNNQHKFEVGSTIFVFEDGDLYGYTADGNNADSSYLSPVDLEIVEDYESFVRNACMNILLYMAYALEIDVS